MGLPVTIPTLTSRKIRVLHLESTDVCQAACPLCRRETDLQFDKKTHNHLRIDQIQQHFDLGQLKSLDKMFMCGNYGDPAAGRHTLEIYRWFRSINPNITLGMNTNGAIQNVAWWTQLGELFHRSYDYVVFSIDGLKDTNHIYRRGVDWDKLIENAQAYINAGGSAHWDMLIYRHNEHQVQECQALAKKLGFKWFRAKVSKRPVTDGLQFPLLWQPGTNPTAVNIRCHALEESSMFIDAKGRASPCCWQGNTQDSLPNDWDSIPITWTTNQPDDICFRACNQVNDTTVFSQQWRVEVAL